MLGGRLRLGAVPKARRREARALLAEAFGALDEGRVTLDLLHRVEALAAPLRILIPRGPRIGLPTLRGSIDRDLVARLWALGDMATAIDARVYRFLSDAGFGERPTFGVKPPVVGPALEVDLELPEG